METATNRAVEWLKCSADPAYFIHHYCLIDEPQGDAATVVPFHLWPAQVATVWSFLRPSPTIALKARQMGISWAACAFDLWTCIFSQGRRGLLFSRGQLEANELHRRVMVMYARLPEWMRARVPLLRQTSSSAEWANGSFTESLPATQNAGRSFTATLVIVDEAAFIQWFEQLYTALKPTIDGGGKLIIISTANGARGLFYNLWQKAVSFVNGFVPVFLDWSMRPGRDAAWYARVSAEAVSSSLMAQEYPSNPAEAFSATDVEKFMTSMIWWDNRRAIIPPLDNRTPCVMGVDAGIINDSFAVVIVSRHWERPDDVAVRYVHEWKPKRDMPVDTNEVEAEIRRLCETFNIVEMAYDPSQMLNMAARLQRDGVVKTRQFPQGADRLESDKQLLDLVLQARIWHDGDERLRAHIDNADKKVDAESRKLRIVKREDSKKIDITVALSMSAYRCLKLPL